ncbi:MAG: SIMPL domain-containing protein [Chitinophagaceae bacterium]|nr:SIMPL domain-containing protein [Chitinophagaceae bacterium]
MKKIVLMLFLFTGVKIAVSQTAGNQVFSNNSRFYADEKSVARHNQLNKLYVSDSGFIIEAKILKNVKADSYVAVFALNQEAKTVQSCNIQINERTKRFINNLLKIGIKETDIYTDLISQYKVYDFNKINNTYEEYLKGFELSKNVIVKYASVDQIEQLLTIASQDSIFDLIKVDYIINDISKVYDDLFVIAKEVIQKKKQLYLNLTEAKLKSGAQIYAENFSSYYPTELYKSYKAFAQNRYSNNYWRNEKETKELHKFETFYYDPVSYSGFDKIINPVVIEPMVQVALTLQIKYDMVK